MGNALALLTPEQLQKLKDVTKLDEKQIEQVLRRYGAYDKSEKGTDGIPIETIAMFPEFVHNPLIKRIAEIYMDPQTRRVFPESFVYFITVLRSETPVDVKRALAFQCFDVHNTGYLQFDEIFNIYKLLFIHALNDDQILDMVYRVLDSPYLTEPKKVSQEDFEKLIPDSEIMERFTCDLQYQ